MVGRIAFKSGVCDCISIRQDLYSLHKSEVGCICTCTHAHLFSILQMTGRIEFKRGTLYRTSPSKDVGAYLFLRIPFTNISDW